MDKKSAYSVAVYGFNQTEQVVLRSIFGLSSRRSPQFVPLPADAGTAADIHLVDTDDAAAIEAFRRSNADSTHPAILIGAQNHGLQWPLIARPLQWTRLFKAFDLAIEGTPLVPATPAMSATPATSAAPAVAAVPVASTPNAGPAAQPAPAAHAATQLAAGRDRDSTQPLEVQAVPRVSDATQLLPVSAMPASQVGDSTQPLAVNAQSLDVTRKMDAFSVPPAALNQSAATIAPVGRPMTAPGPVPAQSQAARAPLDFDITDSEAKTLAAPASPIAPVAPSPAMRAAPSQGGSQLVPPNSPFAGIAQANAVQRQAEAPPAAAGLQAPPLRAPLPGSQMATSVARGPTFSGTLAPAPAQQPAELDWALVVDDNATVREFMRSKLAPFQINVDFAESGEEAIGMTAKRQYTCVFLDVVMPGMDGYQVCKLIKARRSVKKTAVVMLTSKGSPFDRIRGTMAGCDSYLTKPVNEDKLLETIAKYLTV